MGVLPGPTRVLPMPRQYGIGRRAPTRAVLSCAALWCLVVRRPRRCVECLVLTFCSVSSTSTFNFSPPLSLSLGGFRGSPGGVSIRGVFRQRPVQAKPLLAAKWVPEL